MPDCPELHDKLVNWIRATAEYHRAIDESVDVAMQNDPETHLRIDFKRRVISEVAECEVVRRKLEDARDNWLEAQRQYRESRDVTDSE